MAHNDFKRYVWLIELLNRADGASFEDIDDTWKDEPILNPDGEQLFRRTFYHHLNAIREIFDLDIYYDPKDKKYRVDDVHKELMSNLSLNSYLNRYKGLRKRVLTEDDPQASSDVLRVIFKAMHEGRKIRLRYRKYGDKSNRGRILEPYCLKMFKRRWYLLAKEGEHFKTFALDDRTEGVEELSETFEFPKDFNADAYFRDAYGVTTGKPQTVTIKAYGRETSYIRSAPIHHSQKEMETGDDYAIFSYSLNAKAPEFIHALLSHGATIEVLEPTSLRETIVSKIEEMRLCYAGFRHE